MVKIKDSRGNPSHTLGIVFVSWLAATATFVYAAYKGEYFIAEYGVFVGTNLAPYIFREWKDKDNASSGS